MLAIQVEVIGFQTCLELFSVVLPTSHMPAGKCQACKHKKILIQYLHAWIFKGDLQACYPILLKSLISNGRMAVSD